MSVIVLKDCPSCLQSNDIFDGNLDLGQGSLKCPLRVKISRGLPFEKAHTCPNCSTLTVYKLDAEQSKDIIYNIQL